MFDPQDESLFIRKGELRSRKKGWIGSLQQTFFPGREIDNLEQWAFEKGSLDSFERETLKKFYLYNLRYFKSYLSLFPFFMRFYLAASFKSLERLAQIIPDEVHFYHAENIETLEKELHYKVEAQKENQAKARLWLLDKDLAFFSLCPEEGSNISALLERLFFHLFFFRKALFEGIFERISSLQPRFLKEEDSERELKAFLKKGGINKHLEKLISFLIQIKNPCLKREEEMKELTVLLSKVFIFAFPKRFRELHQESRLEPACRCIIEHYLFYL